MVLAGAESYLIVQGRRCCGRRVAIARRQIALTVRMLLTPPSTLRALSAGYRPVLHEAMEPIA